MAEKMVEAVTGKRDSQLHLARRAWTVMEPYHALIYFAPEATAAYAAAGLKGFWMGYFASRAAALGPVSAEVVTATFYNFHPNMVRRAIPDAWRFAAPSAIIAARYQAANAALQRLLGAHLAEETIAEATELARMAVAACNPAGRSLFAAHLALPWPQEPHLALWHAATLLREYRGDGHVAALLVAGLDGCEAHISFAATGTVARATLQPYRGWSDAEWAAAQERLIERGLVAEKDSGIVLTPDGLTARQLVEEQTDLLALPPWQALGEARYNRLLSLMLPLSGLIVQQGGIPVPNPMGLVWPAAE